MSRYDPPVEQQCVGKKRYRSWKHATNDVRAMRERYRNDDPDRHLEPYHCRYCGGIHLGHSPNGHDRNRRPRKTRPL